MSEKNVRDYDKFMLRLPEGMRDAIAERAKANGRSMNSEIVQILDDALNDKTGVDSFAFLMAKMATWYEGMAPVLEQIKNMDDDQLKKFVDDMENKKPT